MSKRIALTISDDAYEKACIECASTDLTTSQWIARLVEGYYSPGRWTRRDLWLIRFRVWRQKRLFGW